MTFFRPSVRWLSILTITSAVSISCSSGPEQYNKGKQLSQSRQQPHSLRQRLENLMDWDLLPLLTDGDQEGGDVEDESLRREMSHKDLIYGYGQGLGGVHFGSRAEESLNNLQKTVGYDFDHDVYSCGLGVLWSYDAPKKPLSFYADRFWGYQGKIFFPPPFTSVALNEAANDFSNQFTDEDPTGEKFTATLYRGFERARGNNVADDFDCISAGLCSTKITDNNDFHYLKFPGGEYLFTVTSPKRLVRVFISPVILQGKLKDSIDLATGEMGKTGITLGQSYAKVKAASGLSSQQFETEIETLQSKTERVKNFSSFKLGFRKNPIPSNSKKIKDGDILELINSEDGWSGDLLLAGKHVLIRPEANSNKVQITLSEAEQKPISENNDLTLRYDLPLEEPYAPSFMQAFAELSLNALKDLESSLSTNADSSLITYSSTSGLHHRGQGPEFLSEVMVYDPQRKNGRWLELGYAPQSQRLTKANIQLLLDPAYQIIAPGIHQAVDLSQKEITASGFTLGEIITIEDHDPMVGEASLKINHKGQELTLRATLMEPIILTLHNGKHFYTENVVLAEIGDIGPRIRLALFPMKEDTQRDEYGKIKKSRSRLQAVLSGYYSQALELCGQSLLPHESYESIVNEKIIAMADTGQAHCNPRKLKRPDGTQKIYQIIFPEKKVRLFFDQFELISIDYFLTQKELLLMEEEKK